MREVQRRVKVVAVVGVLVVCSIVSAQGAPEEAASMLNVGPGILYRSSPYKGADDIVLPVPIVLYDSESWFFVARRGGYHLLKEGGLALDLIGEVRVDGYDDDDSSILKHMSDREKTIDGGVSASYSDGWGQTTVSLVSDLLGEHEGQEINLGYRKKFVTQNGWSLTPSLGFIWQSSDLTDYYYGVRSKEARLGRPRYAAGEAWNPYVMLQTMRQIDANWSFLGVFRYKWLDDEITDSPIVGDNYEILALAGVMYKF